MTVDRGPVVLAFVTDDRFMMATTVAARSALDALRSDRPVEVHVVGAGVTPDAWARFELSLARPGVELSLIHADPTRFADVAPSDGERVLHLRTLLPDLLPDHDRVLYLDSDLLVRRDVSELFDVELGDTSTGAVRDYLTWYVCSRGGIPGAPDLPPFAPYVNSGVMVLALDRWRQRDITGRVEGYLRHTRSHRHPDQDAVNVALVDDVTLVDPRWNVHLPSMLRGVRAWPGWPRRTFPGEPPSPFPPEVVAGIRNDPFIVHYTTGRKPWVAGCANPTQGEWMAVLDHTAWRDAAVPVRPGRKELYRRFRYTAFEIYHRYVREPREPFRKSAHLAREVKSGAGTDER